ncbi:MAG: aminotransferase class IV [Proteobacteria bacterium]|nr:aminotransferase class IV [Pseudomonadota bacterium]
MTAALPVWIDGELHPRERPALRADDSAFLEGRGCYTTARVVAGRPRWPERHARRLRRDARTLGLGEVDEQGVQRALQEIAEAIFPDGDGVVRLEVSCDGDGRLHLVGVPRTLGEEPDLWTAVVSTVRHPGPMPWGGAKVTSHLYAATGRREADDAGADEALLFDRADLLVEGTRSNLLFVAGDGRPRAASLSRGGVAGLGLEVLRERLPELGDGDLGRHDLFDVSELIALNSIRGAHALVRVDGHEIGSGCAGPWARRIADLLSAD